MAVLITGSSGKTSGRLARLMEKANIPYLLASRRGPEAVPQGMPAIRFDWSDESTFKNPFEYKFPGDAKISSVYLVAPAIPDPAPLMNAFIDYAVKDHGVKRFVLIGGSTNTLGGPYIGKVWQHLVDQKLGYAVLRPTWFMEGAHIHTIKGESKIYSACGDGKIPFVSAEDIAAVAFHALMDEKPHNTDHSIVGRDLLSFDEVAAKIGTAIGKEVEHVKLTSEERTKQLQGFGLPEYLAQFLTWLEVKTAEGHENFLNEVVKEVTGRAPVGFDDFVAQNKAAWQ
ncbi:hypothetical protein T310_2725 [Rasamsonia emersonii CBS 393.64]|uniref:NAD(P)-binding domain-containing protein n=1 Tax=Rasamsonia emersonii (strain ATCC 16479 / CBS 393.64 / IMI 116815) TaxID=1408163 RepID=A0A0F4YY71_RASE3|nr:hypothetical protein T310_2725 [Rasamsonia emersonii CBS 393.64]KKA23232.1 hypothetical protein T310_2725 [Rasamsonia emersonii CBS 393.64]